ncbi:MAG: glutaredoxin domain-containing protein [bacterium]
MRIALKILVCLMILVSSIAAASEIYRWVDEQGKVQFGDRPPSGAGEQAVDLRINTYAKPEIQIPPSNRPSVRRNKKVVMYSAEWCGVCKQARRYFTEQRIRFAEYDVEKSQKGQEDYRALRARGVPVILVGKSRLNGFTPQYFEQLYGR